MYFKGFVKVAAITPALKVGNPAENVDEMLRILKNVNAAVAVFPELGVSAYTCGDLFFQRGLLSAVEAAVERILKTNPFEGIVIFGAPLEWEDVLYNVALVVHKDKILGAIPKFYLPNTGVYHEKRWFTAGFDIIQKRKTVRIFGQTVPFGALVFKDENGPLSFGVEICEDMWAPLSPGNLLSLQGAGIIFNLSASNDYLDKRAQRQRIVLEHSRRNHGAYVYCGAGSSESTSETVFSGHKILAQNGALLGESESFSGSTDCLVKDIDLLKISYARKQSTSYRDALHKIDFETQTVYFSLAQSETFAFESPLDKTPFVPRTEKAAVFDKISTIQETALAKRMKHIGAKTFVIGISGGLDSALALLVSSRVAATLGIAKENVLGVTLPALATSPETLERARRLIQAVGAQTIEADISDHVHEHFDLIGHDKNTTDAAYENTQARLRTSVLMNMANMRGGIVIGTGDMSELALGWCTYNADQMSMYGVNAGLPKTLVRFMARAYAKTYFDQTVEAIIDEILAAPISPELVKGQMTEDTLGTFEINDFILDRLLRAGDDFDRIEWLIGTVFGLEKATSKAYADRFFERFYAQQYKRQTLPDSPKVLDISLSPRGDLKMPSDIEQKKR